MKVFYLLIRSMMQNLAASIRQAQFELVVLNYGTMIFPVVMYGYESWTIKKAERQIIHAFELWCWRRHLKSSLDCKEIQPVHPKGDQS